MYCCHRSSSMRRTASWGSRDAFTDGHLSTHADTPVVPPGRRTLAATTKAHRQKRPYLFARSSGAQVPQAQGQRRSQSTDRPTLSDAGRERGWGMPQRLLVNAEAARRMSAPEAPPGDNMLTPLYLLKACMILLRSMTCMVPRDKLLL